MKAVVILALAASTLALGACQYVRYPHFLGAGNPNHTPYAGEPGSVYDRAANPPFNPPPAFFNPQAPLPAAPVPLPPAPAAR